MRSRRNLLSGYRTHERSFYTESEFLRFAGTRSQDDLIDLVRTVPSGLTDTLPADLDVIKQPEPPRKAKAASASH